MAIITSKYRQPKTLDRIDNKSYTMKEALSSLLTEMNTGVVDIASAFFRLSGLIEIKKELIEFMNHSTEFPAMRWLFSNHLEEETCVIFDEELFFPDNIFFNQIMNWIKNGKIEVKVFVGEEFIKTNDLKTIEFLHGKAYLFSESKKSTTGHVLIGSSNFTQAGLVKNRELNIYSNDTWGAITDWFNEIWENYSSKYDKELIKELNKEREKAVIDWTEHENSKTYTPASYVYYQLAKYYGEKKDKTLDQRIRTIESYLPYPKRKDGSKLFIHQRQGIAMIYDKLLKQDTVVLADGVGLGKTLEAATVIKLYLEDFIRNNDRRKVLILANSRLEEQWFIELNNVRVRKSDYDIITRQSFALKTEQELEIYADYYGLIIIDEAHEGFLKPGNKAYRNMHNLVSIARHNKSYEIYGLLMTATPWNNSREDVVRMGTLFLNGRKVEENRQYRSYLINDNLSPLYETKKRKEINQVAYEQFWNDVYIQRTRRSLSRENHLSDKYPKRVFPLEKEKKEAYRISYSLEVSMTLNEILEELIQLKLPYQDTIIQYFSNSASSVVIRQRQQLLRRADSSNVAFEKSLKNIDVKLKKFEEDIRKLLSENLSIVKKYFKTLVDKRFFGLETDKIELNLEYEDDWIHDIGRAKLARVKLVDETLKENNFFGYLEMMLKDVEFDRISLQKIINNWQKISNDDRKKEAICDEIRKELNRGHKVLLFTEFADTAEYYYNELMNDLKIRPYGVGFASGKFASANNEFVDKEDVLGRFSPSSKKYEHELLPGEEINILIGTDAISTGQNLQDATVIMTIELPYNPMRLEQRIGRIDRPKEYANNEIFVYAFPSDEIINAEISLLDKYQTKAQSASEDTDSDVNLPFMIDIKERGLSEALTNVEKNETEFDFLSKPVQVSEQEAKYRLYDYYELNRWQEESFLETIDLYPKIAYTGYEKLGVLLISGILKDINRKSVFKIERPLIFDSDINEMELVEAEANLLLANSNYYHSVEELPESEAKYLFHDNQDKMKIIRKKVVDKFNINNNEKLKVEDTVLTIRELTNELNLKKREYILNFKSSGADPKKFTNIVNSLNKRGFNKQQKEFIGELKGENGKLNMRLVRDKIWNELPSFIRVFEQEFYTDFQQDNLAINNADFENTEIEAIAILCVAKLK
ncbi:helicase-related protein [Carnobacterium maltaromaticum]|uniref:helicase-related protein n=1 Tax=Carnobacterium maltaromaticum TaxID=2751 RepID=UPI00191BACD4|nr:helicase-related protein [Carnobacterium maltaromaticum]CAD5901358.1 DNA helicase [Carnobacterium maltaromaticum]